MSNITGRLNKMLNRLEASGRRITRQRAVVCEALLAHGGHPTTMEVRALAQRYDPSISQATVYNTIAALEEAGAIHKLDIAGDEHAHYDVDTSSHVNAVCTRCGKITDVHTDTLEALLVLVASRSSYRTTPSAGVIIYGLCAECQEQQSSSSNSQ